MNRNIYGKKRSIPLSNKILMIASLVCVAAAVVVFIFFNKHQKNKNNENTVLKNSPSPTVSSEATPAPAGDPIVPSGTTVLQRFNPPAGYQRIQPESGSFEEYLQNFTLRDYGTKPLVYDTETKTLINDESAPAVSVLALDLINKGNLQQSSDSMVRLYAEYLYSKGRFSDIAFNLLTTPAFRCDFDTWSKGGRLDLSKINEGNQISWCLDHSGNCGHKDVELGTSAGTFRYYLQNVMTYSDTSSLVTNMNKISAPQDAAIGDMIVYADPQAAPAIIIDLAVSASDGSKIYIMARGGSPACEIYIVRNESDADRNPWHKLSDLPIGASLYRFQ